MKAEYDFTNARKNPYSNRLKKQITINIDSDTSDYFKAQSQDSGIQMCIRDRAVGDLHKDVVANAQGLLRVGVLAEGGQGGVVEQVLGDAGALGLPIQPDAAGAVVDVVAAENHVDGGVHLNAANLRAREVLLVVDVVDVVVLDDGEHAAQVAHNAGLAAVVDVAAADDVVADCLLYTSRCV